MPEPDPSPDLLQVGDDSHFRLVADSTYDWETWLSPVGKPVWVNPAVLRITGYAPEDCLAMSDYPLPLVCEEDRVKFAGILASIRNFTSGNDVEFRIRRRDGEKLWVAISWQPMYDGQVHLGFRTSVRDISIKQNLREELRMYAQDLEEAVKQRTERLRNLERKQVQMEKLAALGQLAASVAHEINNPLAGIRNALTLIRSDFPGGHPHQEIFDLIDKEIDRMSGIVAQMYQSYRRQSTPARRFDLVVTIKEVLYFLEAVARERGVTIENGCGPSPAMVELPEDEIKQVIYNLVRNAVQASPQGHRVDVSLQPTATDFQIAVADEGAGITADHLPSIFEPFFSTKGNDAGTGMGLGLSVSRAIIESLGGRIEVQTTPGHGSRFSVIIPR
jgi:two-component system sporulation sensor kinase C